MIRLAAPLVVASTVLLLFGYLSTQEPKSSEMTQESPACPLFNNTNFWRVCKDICLEQETLFLQLKKRIGYMERQAARRRSRPVRQNVIILSYPGAGSQVLGKILNDDPRVLYLSEPLDSLAYYIKYNPSLGFSLSTHLLNNLFQCKFDEHEFFVSDLNKNLLRFQSRAFSSSRMCGGWSSSDLHTNSSHKIPCHDLNSINLRKLCYRETDITVARTTLVKSLDSLSVLMDSLNEEKFQVRVIHFVRDPRRALEAVLSRQSLSVTKLTTKTRKLCNQMLLNFKYAESGEIDWVRGNYKLVKFEELIAYSTRVTKDIYKFINFSTPFDRIPAKPLLPNFAANVTKMKYNENNNNELENIVLEQCSEIINLLKY